MSMRFVKNILKIALPIVLLAMPARAATKYVAPSGSTSWSHGATVGDPIDLSTFNNNAHGGDVAIMANGTYPTTISPATSGTSYTSMVSYVGNLDSPASVVVNGVSMASRSYISVKGVQFAGNLNISGAHDSLAYCIGTSGAPNISLGGDDACISNSTFNGDILSISGGPRGPGPEMVWRDSLLNCTINIYQNRNTGQAAMFLQSTDSLLIRDCRIFLSIGPNGIHGMFKSYTNRKTRIQNSLIDFTSVRAYGASDECNTSYIRDYSQYMSWYGDTLIWHGPNTYQFMISASGSFSNSVSHNAFNYCVFRYEPQSTGGDGVGGPGILWWQNIAVSDTINRCVVITPTSAVTSSGATLTDIVLTNNTFVTLSSQVQPVSLSACAGSVTANNNIFYQPHGTAGGASRSAFSGDATVRSIYTGDNNLFYCSNASGSSIYMGGVGYGPTTQCSGISQECNSVYGDPLFIGGTDAMDFDARLSASSPAIAINAGAYAGENSPLGLPSDFTASYYYNSTPGVAVIYTAANSLGSGSTGVDSIVYSVTPIRSAAAFSAATLWATKTITDSLGLSVGRRANGLSWGTTYYFAVKTTNNLGDNSDIVSDTISTPAYPAIAPPTSFVVNANTAIFATCRIGYAYNITTDIGLGTSATDTIKVSTTPITNQYTFSSATTWTTVNSSAHNGGAKTGVRPSDIDWSSVYYVAIKTTNNLGDNSVIVMDSALTVDRPRPYVDDFVASYSGASYSYPQITATISFNASETSLGLGTYGDAIVRYSTSPIVTQAQWNAATAVGTVEDFGAFLGTRVGVDAQYPTFSFNWNTTYYFAARLYVYELDDSSTTWVSDSIRTPSNPTDPALTMGNQPLIAFGQNCISNDYPAYTPWKNFLNNAGTAMDTVGLRKLSYFNEVTIPQSALDSASAEGTRMLMLHAVERLRSLRSNIRIYGYMPSFTTWYTSSPSWTGADSTQWKYDIKAQTWVGIRKTAGWATGMGYDTNSPHAVADSTHGPQYLWNKVPGFKGMFSGARYGAETFGGATAGSTNCNAWTNLNLNIAYKSGSTYPVIDTLVSVFVRTILTRQDSNGRYLYDGLFNDLWVWNLSNANYNSKDSVDWSRAGYSSFAAMDSAWTQAAFLYALRLREACLQYNRPNFIITGNYGGGFGFQYLNGWTHEDWPLLQGGTWFSNFTTNNYPKTATQSVIYGGSMQNDAANYRQLPQHNITSFYTHGGFADTGYVGIDTAAVTTAKIRYGMATNCLFDNMVTIVQPKGLDNSLAAYRIDWWPDEYAVNTATGVAGKGYGYTNWLGVPNGAFYNWCPAQADSEYGEGKGTFNSAVDRSGWITFSSGGTVAFVSDTVASGAGAVRIRQLTPYPSAYWNTGIKLAQQNYASNGDSFCITMQTRADVPRFFRVVLFGKTSSASRGAYNVWATTQWQQQRIVIPLNAGSPESVSVRIWAADSSGAIWLDDIQVHKHCRGGTFIRDYAKGSVYVNPYSWADTIRVAGTKRRITSQYSPYVNNGRGYSDGTYVIIPAESGLFLVNGGSGGSGDITTGSTAPAGTNKFSPWWKRFIRPHWR